MLSLLKVIYSHQSTKTQNFTKSFNTCFLYFVGLRAFAILWHFLTFRGGNNV